MRSLCSLKTCASLLLLATAFSAMAQLPTPRTQDMGAKNGEDSKGKDSKAAPAGTPNDGKSPALADDPTKKGAGPSPTASGTPLSQTPTDPTVAPQSHTTRPRIGLALGGGGALALSEIGVLQWFDEHHIPVDMIAGTSMGSLVGAMYATGQTPAQMREIVSDDLFDSVFQMHAEYKARSFRRREDSRELPNGLGIGLKHGVSFRNSLFADSGLNTFLVKEFVRYDDQTVFNDLPIPFRCVATDLGTADTVTFVRGSIPNAVRASVAIPGLYQPFAMNGHEYVDGGVLENLPTPELREMKPDVVLAVSIPLQPLGKSSLDSIVGVFQRSFSATIEAREREERKLADVVVMPDIKGFGTSDYKKIKDLAQIGYAAAEKQRDLLLKYAVTDEEWNAYVSDKATRMRHDLGPVLRVEVKAPNPDVQKEIARKFAPLANRPLDTKKIDRLLTEVRSDGRYQAAYTVGYETHDSIQPIVLVTLDDKSTGPPFLTIGGNVQAASGSTARANIEGMFVWQDFGGYGSELRARAQAGYGMKLNLEYFRRLRFGGLFFAPRGNFERQPYYIYDGNGHRLSERILQTGGGGGDLGWSNARTMELRAGWEANDVRWRVDTGSDTLPDYLWTAQRARVRFAYDTQDRDSVPQYGVRVISEAAYLYRTHGSPSAPQLSTQISYAHRLGEKNVMLLAGDGGTMLNRNVAQPFRYTLGGPYRLSASAIDQFRGTDYFLTQGIYLRRIAQLPSLLGQSIYAGGIYEAGQMRAPNAATITRQDISFGVLAETPLGAVTLAPVVDFNGQWRFVFTLGRLF